MDETMIYGTAGVAWTDTEYYVNDHTNSTSPSEMGTLDLDGIGIVAGAGVEAKVSQMWSIRGEALYFWFNDRQEDTGLTHDSDPGDFAELKDGFVVRFGANALFTSDRCLKRDIAHVATLETGIKLYRFKYLWDDQVHVGVMAQDLLGDEVSRHAVVMTQNGYYAVNYEALGLKMATLEAWRDYGLAAVSLQAPGSRVSSLMENVLR